MESTKRATLAVPGARLYYELCGSGPLLLVLQGGEGDAGRTAALVRELRDRYTMLTYDRRGLSRSTVDEPMPPITIETHADDVHRLLAAVTGEPATLLGSSFGGLVGLVLATAHPDQVATLVTHEPPALGVLPGPERARAERVLLDLEATFREEGWAAAFKKLAEATGAGYDDREPEVELPPPLSPERIANMKFLFTHDLPAVRTCRLDAGALATLRGGPVRVVPAAGHTTARDFFDHRCAAEIARLLGTELAEFPGGHNGLTMRPKAFTRRLLDVIGVPG
ncbi:putative hydrolase YraK [Sphaerisporangium rufum]|uniref:Hydrolase YraK n=1 Tax=Sphaerisporangium rufum TaxID=1381558 RepID=A0A919V3V7_9ACTN|nr:alpha/beta hydrolase [Sphaerisporangium rufum]GII81252.1 putative hydrolase YraK [Sphaerisporangium rufum]